MYITVSSSFILLLIIAVVIYKTYIQVRKYLRLKSIYGEMSSFDFPSLQQTKRQLLVKSAYFECLSLISLTLGLVSLLVIINL